MTIDPEDLTPARLRDHQRFLSRLARGLVRDEHAADDLVQDAWVAALRQPAVAPGFLARVLRNRSADQFAARSRRAQREADVARDEAVEATSPAEELEIQARVLAAVKELAEPVQSAIWMRYWRDLSPRDIARETGVALDTVKSRLARGRALLRERLDRELGTDGRSGCAVLLAALPNESLSALPLPVGVGAAGTAISLSGAVWMGTTGKVLLASAACVGAFFLLRDDGRDAQPDPRVGGVVSDASELASPAAVAPSTDTSARVELEREAGAAPPRATPTVARAPAALAPLGGRVFDDEAQPVASVRVVLRGGASSNGRGISPTARTGADGAFRFADSDREARGGRFEVDDPAWVTIGAALPGGDGRVVVVGRPFALAGVVLDAAGDRVDGATLAIELPRGFRSRFPIVLDNTLGYRPNATSGADGRFAFVGAARVRGAQLVASKGGYETRRVPLDEVEAETTVVLHRLGFASDVIDGQVVDAFGRPVEGASVSFGGERTSTDDLGLFVLKRASELGAYERLSTALGRESRTLAALKPGYLPATLDVELDERGLPRWPDGVVLVLDGTPLELAGRVVERDGAPVADATLWLADVTLFSMTEGGQATESLLGGSDARYPEFRTNASGEFAIQGLLPRDYTLVAMHPETYVVARTAPIAAGSTSVELVLDGDATHDVVAGRVRSATGAPEVGATVLVMTDASAMHFEDEFVRTSNLMMKRATTDERGRFRFEDVPQAHTYLQVMGDEIEPLSFPLEAASEHELDDLELDCVRRVHVRLTLDGPGVADEFAILDDGGAPVAMRVYQGKPGPPTYRAPLYGTTSDTLSVAENGRTLVLFRDGVEVDRRTIRLWPGEVNEL